MDERSIPTSGGPTLAVEHASSWRPVERALHPVLVSDAAARRSAAFVAHVAGALERTQRRWF